MSLVLLASLGMCTHIHLYKYILQFKNKEHTSLKIIELSQIFQKRVLKWCFTKDKEFNMKIVFFFLIFFCFLGCHMKSGNFLCHLLKKYLTSLANKMNIEGNIVKLYTVVNGIVSHQLIHSMTKLQK